MEYLCSSILQANQGGLIGITLLGSWHEPLTDTPQDSAAAARMNDFHIGWLVLNILVLRSKLLSTVTG
jgi:hypothetical protein